MNQIFYPSMTIGEIVKENHNTIEIFKKYNIDFCCGGKKTIGEACYENDISLNEFTKELNETSNKNNVNKVTNFKDWDLDFLANYIVNVHHKYITKNIPLLLEFTEKIKSVHGEHHPELQQIAALYSEVAAELQQHMLKEEKVLFPYIVKLQTAFKNKTTADPSPFGTVSSPISMMEMEHENVGLTLRQMREISLNYEVPEDACSTYAITYKKLDEFENDLHQHIHLENNILFPGAIELEEKLKDQ